MVRRDHGFSILELLLVLVISGILLAIGAANYGVMQKRAWEASTKANMHTFQLAAEDYGVRYGTYGATADAVSLLLTQGGSLFYNPFVRTTGSGQAWVDQPTWARPLTTGSTRSGIVAYGDSSGATYQIAGRGASGDLPLVYLAGQ
jgi:prepilin-type N-terminal cleavage/methylation domain-containing protein